VQIVKLVMPICCVYPDQVNSMSEI